MSEDSIRLHIGPDEIVLRRRYELLSIGNDILVAVFFISGSILFLQPSTTTAGTWLFLLGSIELLVRPMIRFGRRVHIGRVGSVGAETSGDF